MDECDKPVLDALAKPEAARANRGFCGAVKDCDEHVGFALLFSKARLFSGLNDLRDITPGPRYGAIRGYAERGLDEVFAPEPEELDRDGRRGSE